MKNDPPIYSKAKAIEHTRTIRVRHNRKSIRAYDNKFHVIMISQTSSLNTAIKNGKQLIIPVTNGRR